ncbi:S-DNA-T family DNA segregation ATPase FtsK/SpoIIIE [Diaminobutyricimonas aerilata]|uniref:S-DNA-T family DNA segregation ATPase FtsK/SpoIIIE n=1 Tax=Diaminobutyricimonas aerilata TaxID=1162967 RepID=A0A2M9CMY5_9MICO|nr:FtsK/SpoIIIE domain-containing protein [Diaminobutyricimonas aerilata]PJJ73267.1 S-DNA-T family DNA segregation ATPase FtsK/SpoIIIE [Diaminobutyricimonas aerilata]
MKLKLAYRRSSGEPVDIVVTADATATVGDVARAVIEADPFSPGAPDRSVPLTLQVAPPEAPKGVTLDPASPIGDAPVGSGFDAATVPAPIHPTGAAGVDPRSAAAVVRVLSGPDAGLEVRLPVGSSTIGRDAGNAVVLSDPLVSKRHARVEITSSTIDVVDMNSANGILVDGGLVPRLRLPSGQSVLLGDTRVSIVLLASASELDDGIIERGGALRFNRSPRVEARYLGREYDAPEVPREKEPQPFNWIIMVAPVLMGAMMFSFTGNPMSLGFIALAPVMAIGNWFAQRSRVGKKTKIEIERFELQIEDLEEQLQTEVPKERALRLKESPSVAEVYAEAHRLGPMLWTRRPEHWNFLDVRLGLGAMPSRNTIEDNDANRGLPAFQRRVDELRDRMRFIDGVPVVENPFLSGALGVCGGAVEAADAVRALLVQYAGLHSPAEVAFAALLSPTVTPEFEWLKWLPHTTSPHSPVEGIQLADSAATGTALLNALEEIIAVRRKQLGVRELQRGASDEDDAAAARGAKVGTRDAASFFTDGGAALVLLIANDAPVDRARLVQLVEDAADAHVFPIWMAPVREALPAACRTFVDVSTGLTEAQVHFVRQGMVVERVAVEGVSVEYARMLARRLAPVVDAGAVIADSSDLPRSVSLLTLLGTDLGAEPRAAVERWTQNNSIHDRSGRPPVQRKRAGTLRALVGQSSPDAMHLDLRTQGPHALVGGTTGSGKSEFLQAWVLGMAAEYSPDRVTFLFVDYKGGSAFAECVNLPHCVGLVTDLSPHLVRRALTSLRAELHHREHLFNRKKAKDLLELEKRGDPECPPALVLVIDEFAALAGEVPEFVDGVVDIAQRGRSLGIHLIMATQRPAGVIKDNLRANTNLRVALRMADESDSKDVVGDPVAGTFDPAIPGRGIAKTGPGRLTPFQSGYAGGWTTDEPDAVSVSVAELRFGATQVWEPPAHESATQDADLGPNDQSRLVANLVEAARQAHIPAPRRPWLDDLGPAYDLLQLPQERDSALVIGISDRPHLQLQVPTYFHPDKDGHMAVYGTGGTGKTALLRSLAVAAGMNPGGGRVAVYGMDFGTGALRGVEVLPHVGAVVSGDDHERIARLLKMIRGELDRRSEAYTAVNAASIDEYRQLARRPDEARILLLLDGFGAFRAEYETNLSRGPLYNAFMRVLGEGRPLGIHVVITADRYGSVPTAVNAAIQRRVVLRMPDEGSYAVLDAPKDVLSEKSPPGRAIVDGDETQLAIIGGTTNVSEQTAATKALAERLVAHGVIPAPPVGALPRELSLHQLPDAVGEFPTLGVSDEALAAMGFDPMGSFVVGGPPLSGKTNALRALTRLVHRWDPSARFFHIGGRRSRLTDDFPWMRSATRVDDAVELIKELNEVVADEDIRDRVVIVIENFPQFAGTPAEKPLTQLAQLINRSDHLLITEADITALGSGFGLVGDMKGGRKGIILKPDTHDGDSVFKVPFPRVARHEFPEGRGLYVQNGQVFRVQLPLVSDTDRVVDVERRADDVPSTASPV